MHVELRANTLWRTSIDVRDGHIVRCVTTCNRGASARVLAAGRWGFYARSGETDPHTLIERAQEISASLPFQGAVLAESPCHHVDKPSQAVYPPHTTEIEEKIREIRTLVESSGIDENPLINHYYLGFNDYYSMDLFENSEGSHIQTEEAATGIIFALMGDYVREGFLIAPYGLEFLSEERVIRKLQEKMNTFPKKVGSPSPGKYTIVFAPEITGILIHEVVGHGLEADKVLRGESVLADHLGEEITSNDCTCIDDPLLENAFGQYSYDDEGVKAEGTPVIKKGVLTSLLHSRETAGALSCNPTANALSESVLCPPLVRTSNIQVLPGNQSTEELCEGADIVVDSLGAAELQYEQDVLSLVAESGNHLVEGYSVRNVNMRINVNEILSHLEGVGKERELVTRHCSKGRQFIPSSSLTPFLKFSEVEVLS
ncbi:MAG: TldD/PmbA family protein [Theionarchaea archaeon]|nr:TldD/PmbA family protein [Theionarchaea archaeon]MBU7036391.1 TldD/PmbA family protein [Theionarchaea archaeon]